MKDRTYGKEAPGALSPLKQTSIRIMPIYLLIFAIMNICLLEMAYCRADAARQA